MDSKLLAHIRTEVKLASWEWFEKHHERGAVFLVDDGLDLAVVGAAIAADDSAQVKGWLEDKLLTVTKDIDWDAESEHSFIHVIVQPYVLVQRVLES